MKYMGLREKLRLSRRNILQSIFIAHAIVFLSAFQNCTGINGLNLDNLQNVTSSKDSGGSGVGYDGKLTGNYYRFIPGYSCAGQPAAKEIIQVQDQGTTLVSNSLLQCESEQVNLPKAAIGESPLQTEFITYNDLIFKHLDGVVSQIPDQLPEVLCRDDFESPQIEIVTHYDRVKSQALGRIYHKNSDGSVSGTLDFNVARVLSPYQVNYQSSELQLSVDLQHPVSGTHRFKGSLGGSRPVTCVTGGLLDVSAWPLHQVTDFRTSNITINYATNSIVVTQDDATGSMEGRKLIQITPDGSYFDLTTNLLNSQYKVNTLTISISGAPLMVGSGVNKLSWRGQEYFFMDLLNRRIIPFGDTKSIENIVTLPSPLQNGELIYNLIDDSSSGIIRKMNLETRKLTDVYFARALQIRILPDTNKVVSVSFTTKRSVLIHDFAAGTQVTISPPIPTSCYPSNRLDYGLYSLYGDYSVFLVLPKANLAIVRYNNCGTSDSLLYGVSLNNQSHIDFGPNACILDYSLDYNWVEIGHEITIPQPYGQSNQSCQALNVTHYDLVHGTNYLVKNNPLFARNRFKNITKQMIPMYTNAPTLQGINYSGYGQSLLKLNESLSLGMIYSSEKPQLIQFNQVTNQTQEICTSAKGDKISLGSMNKDIAYLLTYSASEQIYFAYKVTPTSCTQINSFPSIKNKVMEIALSKSGLGLIVGDDTKDSPTLVYFMPFNGKPTYLLNLFEQDIYTALNFKINSNTGELFLNGFTKGNGFNKGSKAAMLYKFVLPDVTN